MHSYVKLYTVNKTKTKVRRKTRGLNTQKGAQGLLYVYKTHEEMKCIEAMMKWLRQHKNGRVHCIYKVRGTI